MLRLSLADRRIEGEDDKSSHSDDEHRRDVEQGLEDHAGTWAARVVIDDRAHTVRAVQHGQPQHQQVPDLPERARPATSNESEVDAVHAAIEDVHDQQVTENQTDQDDA